MRITFLLISMILMTYHSKAQCSHTLQFNVVDATCGNSNDGAINLTVIGGVPPFDFFWGTFDTTQNISNLSGGRYVVIVTDSNGCNVIDSAFVYAPDRIITTGVSQGAGCGNASDGTLSTTTTGGILPYTYLWSNGATAEDLQNLQGGLYTLTVSDSIGCSMTNTWSVSSLPQPIVDFSVDRYLCLGDTNIIINHTQLLSGTLTYKWNFGNSQNSTQTNPSISYNSLGGYTIKLVATSDMGCKDSLSKNIDVILCSACIADFTLQKDTATSYHWYAINQSNGSPSLTYIWYWGDGDSSIGQYPSHTYDTAGYYNVCLTISDNIACNDTYCDSSAYIYKHGRAAIVIDVVDQIPVTISENDLNNNHFSIYPNPANNKLNITTALQGNEGIQYQIINTLGSIVASHQTTTPEFSIDISALPAGIYFLQLQSGNAHAVKRWVKE